MVVVAGVLSQRGHAVIILVAAGDRAHVTALAVVLNRHRFELGKSLDATAFQNVSLSSPTSLVQ